METILCRLLIFSALLSVPHSLFAASQYHIGRLHITFQPLADAHAEMQDIRTELIITYDIQQGPKYSGFKYVGTQKIKDVSVTFEVLQTSEVCADGSF